MKQLKVEVIIAPIYDQMKSKYQMIYGSQMKKNSLEAFIFKELEELKNRLTLEEALLFVNTFSCLSSDLASQEQKLKREFVYCHLVYLFPKKMTAYSSSLLCLICEAVTKKNINHSLFLKLLADETWMQKVFEHALMIDYHSSLVNYYHTNQERIKRIFHFLCRRIEQALNEIEEVEFSLLKKELLKIVKSYQSTELYKRSVT